MTTNTDHRPLFVFAISGATWDVINPMIEKGLLPTFAKLKQQGTSAPLKSIKAPGDKHFRPQVAFPSIATGSLPQHHGITEFYHTSENLARDALWHHFNHHGYEAGLYGWPMTWPAKDIQGFVIPCHHARDSHTLPMSLSAIKQLDRQQQNAERGGSKNAKSAALGALCKLLLKYPLGLSSLVPLVKTAIAVFTSKDKEKRSMLLRKAKFYLSCGLSMALYRKHRPALMMFNTFYVDLIEHRFWRYHQPELFGDDNQKPQFKNVVEQSYQQVDEMLGNMLKQLPDNAVTAVVSEHGMAVETQPAEVGNKRYAIRANEVKRLTGLPDDIQVLPIARWVALRYPDGRPVEDNIKKKLSSLKVSQTGLPLFNVHANGASETIIKFNLNDEADSYRHLELSKLTIEFDGQTLPFESMAQPSSTIRSAMHDEQGILLLHGEGIKAGKQLQDASVIDVAPTLLDLCNMPPLAECDGKVLNLG